MEISNQRDSLSTWQPHLGNVTKAWNVPDAGGTEGSGIWSRWAGKCEGRAVINKARCSHSTCSCCCFSFPIEPTYSDPGVEVLHLSQVLFITTQNSHSLPGARSWWSHPGCFFSPGRKTLLQLMQSQHTGQQQACTRMFLYYTSFHPHTTKTSMNSKMQLHGKVKEKGRNLEIRRS